VHTSTLTSTHTHTCTHIHTEGGVTQGLQLLKTQEEVHFFWRAVSHCLSLGLSGVYTPYTLRNCIHRYPTHQLLQTYTPTHNQSYKRTHTMYTYPTPTYLPYIPTLPLQTYKTLHTYPIPTYLHYSYKHYTLLCMPVLSLHSRRTQTYSMGGVFRHIHHVQDRKSRPR